MSGYGRLQTLVICFLASNNRNNYWNFYSPHEFFLPTWEKVAPPYNYADLVQNLLSDWLWALLLQTWGHGAWCGFMNNFSKKKCVQRDWHVCSKYDHYSELDSQHKKNLKKNWGGGEDLYDHLMSTRNLIKCTYELQRL